MNISQEVLKPSIRSVMAGSLQIVIPRDRRTKMNSAVKKVIKVAGMTLFLRRLSFGKYQRPRSIPPTNKPSIAEREKVARSPKN